MNGATGTLVDVLTATEVEVLRKALQAYVVGEELYCRRYPEDKVALAALHAAWDMQVKVG